MEELINSFENGQNRYLECNYFRHIIDNIFFHGATERQIIISLIEIMKEQDENMNKIQQYVNYSRMNNTISIKDENK